MKFDPLDWILIKSKEVQNANGKISLRGTEPLLLFVETEGVQALAGRGYQIEVTVPEGSRYHVETSGQTWAYQPPSKARLSSGVEMTNVDNRPVLSGSYLEILRSERMLRALEQRIDRKGRVLERKLSDASRPAHAKLPQERLPQEDQVLDDVADSGISETAAADKSDKGSD